MGLAKQNLALCFQTGLLKGCICMLIGPLGYFRYNVAMIELIKLVETLFVFEGNIGGIRSKMIKPFKGSTCTNLLFGIPYAFLLLSSVPQ